MDVNARRADVEAAEQQDVDMDEIFTMEAEDIKNCKYIPIYICGKKHIFALNIRTDRLLWHVNIDNE